MPDARPYAQLKEALFPAGLLVFTVFIFGPFTIYFWNPGELEIGYLSVLSTIAPLVFLVAVLLLIPAYLLPAKGFRFYNPLLLGIGMALWLQGSVIVGSYGFLDGTQIDFAAQGWRVWHETALWLGRCQVSPSQAVPRWTTPQRAPTSMGTSHLAPVGESSVSK